MQDLDHGAAHGRDRAEELGRRDDLHPFVEEHADVDVLVDLDPLEAGQLAGLRDAPSLASQRPKLLA
jgi:hypothetical protein